MSIIEIDTATHDASLWDVRINKALKEHNTLFPSLEDRSEQSGLYVRSIRFTAIDEDRLLREVVVYQTDDEGNAVPGSERPLEEQKILERIEITEAHIKVGSTRLVWQETYVPKQKSA